MTSLARAGVCADRRVRKHGRRARGACLRAFVSVRVYIRMRAFVCVHAGAEVSQVFAWCYAFVGAVVLIRLLCVKQNVNNRLEIVKISGLVPLPYFFSKPLPSWSCSSCLSLTHASYSFLDTHAHAAHTSPPHARMRMHAHAHACACRACCWRRSSPRWTGRRSLSSSRSPASAPRSSSRASSSRR